MLNLIVVVAALAAGALGSPKASPAGYRKFPENFKFALATSSYQVEGAWNEGGRTPSIWDEFSQNATNIGNDKVSKDVTGNIASNQYHMFKEDIDDLVKIGVHNYRFSISWSRLMSARGKVNPEGVDYYNRLINYLLEKNIDPIITLYHWDLPMYLAGPVGGWESRGIVAAFEEYADLCFSSFGDRVKTWITINEPWCVAGLGYGYGNHAPGYQHKDRGVYLAAHHTLLSHAKASKLYQKKYIKLSPNGEGKIGITLNSDWVEPKTNSELDKAAALRANEFNMAWFADPIYFGEYPEVMRKKLGDRLPTFTAEEKELMIGSNMYYGLNMYCANYGEHMPETHPSYGKSGWGDDMQVIVTKDPEWLMGGASWLSMNPKGLEMYLRWISERYGNPGILITENGWSIEGDTHGELKDASRVQFLQSYLNSVLDAIEHGVHVIGYGAWSAIDNFEWAEGYSVRFGYIRVDFDDEKRTRTWKDSAYALQEIVQSHSVIAMDIPDFKKY